MKNIKNNYHEKLEIDYTHKKPNDIKMFYSREGKKSELRLYYSPEYPDGENRMITSDGEDSESFEELLDNIGRDISLYQDIRTACILNDMEDDEDLADNIYDLMQWLGTFPADAIGGFANAIDTVKKESSFVARDESDFDFDDSFDLEDFDHGD